MKTLHTILLMLFFVNFNFGQCKSVTAYKYKNADEVLIQTSNIRCSKGISDHVSRDFLALANIKINSENLLSKIY